MNKFCPSPFSPASLQLAAFCPVDVLLADVMQSSWWDGRDRGLPSNCCTTSHRLSSAKVVTGAWHVSKHAKVAW